MRPSNKNNRARNLFKISLKKEAILIPLSKIKKLKENTKNTSLSLNKKIDNSYNYRTSTVNTENNERLKTNYETVLTNPSLLEKNNRTINNQKINAFKKNTFYNKKIFRPKTTSKTRFLSNKNKNKELNLNLIFRDYNKNKSKNKYNGVPISFIESMRLNIKQNLIKAENFLENEKNKLKKNNPYYRYQLIHEETVKRQKEELERINQFKLWKKYLQNKDNIYEENKLNNYYTKLLLRDNNQYFNNPDPVINKKKFDSKYRLLTDYNEDKNNFHDPKKLKVCKDIRNIFSNVLNFNVFTKDKNEPKIKKFEKKEKKIIYEMIKKVIKKSAIEFKNMAIPLKEYIAYVNFSKNTIDNLFSNDYAELTKMIKMNKDEKKIIDYITDNKILIFTVNTYGQNILILAVKYKLYKAIPKIIQFGSNINLQDFKGRTALHFACINHDITAVIILLYYLSNPYIKDNNGESPLDIALNSGQDNYIIKDLLIRCRLIRKINKYRSWKEYDVSLRRGIQYYLAHNLLKEEYHLIFSYIDNAVLYYS